MIHFKTSNKLRLVIITVAVIGFIYIGIGSLPAYSHGGKTHGGEIFTAFQAVQKATQMYDQLISSGKLPEVWETELKSINIAIRKSTDKREYVIQFQRAEGDPDSVYFFFNQQGKYSGSNFTGK
jgi:hypothetical protein